MIDDDISLCLTPQGFNNVDAQSDIFNNLNLSFWEYMLPGTDALGYIACTGTNFCLRCAPLADCGWFPSWTITEDYALGMILKAKARPPHPREGTGKREGGRAREGGRNGRRAGPPVPAGPAWRSVCLGRRLPAP